MNNSERSMLVRRLANRFPVLSQAPFHAVQSRARAILARRNLADFVKQAWSIVEPTEKLHWNWHHDAICLHLEAVARGRIKRLIINVPPGSMKSLLASVFFPAWRWSDDASWRVLSATYTEKLSLRDSTKCRNVLVSPWYRENFMRGWDLSGDQNVKSFFETTRTGFRISLSTTGSGTGFRGHCLIIDDPNDADDAWSLTKLVSTNDWYDQKMSNRLNDETRDAIVLIQQRLHENDLTGHLLKQGGWDHLCLPAEFVPERRCRTSIGWEDPRQLPGELLDPKRLTREVLAAQKRIKGSSGYAGQYQQDPVAEGGNIIKREWFKRFRTPPTVFDECLQSWDFTFKGKEDSDFVVGQFWGRKSADYYLLDQVRERLNYPQSRQALKDFTRKWSDPLGVKMYGVVIRVPASHAKLVEDKANGPAIMDDLRAEIPGLIAVEPDGEKTARLRAVSPVIEAGNVWIPENAPWVLDYLDELGKIPKAQNDDQGDATSQALRKLTLAMSELAQFEALSAM